MDEKLLLKIESIVRKSNDEQIIKLDAKIDKLQEWTKEHFENKVSVQKKILECTLKHNEQMQSLKEDHIDPLSQKIWLGVGGFMVCTTVINIFFI